MNVTAVRTPTTADTSPMMPQTTSEVVCTASLSLLATEMKYEAHASTQPQTQSPRVTT